MVERIGRKCVWQPARTDHGMSSVAGALPPTCTGCHARPSRSRHLHVAGPDGNVRPFITGEVHVTAIDWTPDGKGISFLAERGDDEHNALYVIPVDGAAIFRSSGCKGRTRGSGRPA